ncbi:PREDICTED: uncharacterized protein LOC109487580 [Branchiostoma belcheri]|uniref:Uncharacterized protein LOC109487580 n=1 Tax=Branchiostoma belcheri TaxID=7741 RepID=A0A6P5AVN4_BRABE|nr:PREDICTED: uncharacterized protein LOC109487580 [Branchiostoma belcheri]
MASDSIVQTFLLFKQSELQSVAQIPRQAILQKTSSGPGAFGHDSEHDLRRVTRRAAPALTREEIGIIVDKHNELRKGADPPASNMEYMSWHEELAGMAQQWSEKCTWEHGQPHRDRPPFSWVGQNLWLGTTWTQGSSIRGAIQAWFNEISNYDYDNASCAHDKVCGHYTQLMWGKSYAIGCGLAFCSNVRGSSITNAYLLTCNYGPGGNYPGIKPYVTGQPCQTCASEKGWCKDGLCVNICTEGDIDCGCVLQCQNGGILNETDCSCACPDGWDGTNCELPCQNTHPLCYCNPGWYGPAVCRHLAAVTEGCREMCGKCKFANVEQDVNCRICTQVEDLPEFCTAAMPKASLDGKTDSRPRPATATITSTSAVGKAEATPGESTVSSRLRPSTEAATARPPPCDGMSCENGGILMKKTCRCQCTENYYGAMCQKSRVEVRFGVIINIRMAASQWYKAKRLLKKAVSRVINKYCTVRFSLCCPYSQEKTSPAQLEFVTEDDIHVGAGYPEVTPPLLKVMLLAKPRENNEMCGNSRTRRDLAFLAVSSGPPIRIRHSDDVVLGE